MTYTVEQHTGAVSDFDRAITNAWRVWHSATGVKVWPATQPLCIFGRPLGPRVWK